MPLPLRALLILALTSAACASDPPPVPAVLPSDAMFLAPGVETCLVSEPNSVNNEYPCCQVLILYAAGDISMLRGLEGFGGTYELDGETASGTLYGQAFAFDLTTGIATGPSLITGTWIPDVYDVTLRACGPP